MNFPTSIEGVAAELYPELAGQAFMFCFGDTKHRMLFDVSAVLKVAKTRGFDTDLDLEDWNRNAAPGAPNGTVIDPERIKHPIAYKTPPLVVLARHPAKGTGPETGILVDGNHRAFEAWRRGEKTMKVRAIRLPDLPVTAYRVFAPGQFIPGIDRVEISRKR